MSNANAVLRECINAVSQLKADDWEWVVEGLRRYHFLAAHLSGKARLKLEINVRPKATPEAEPMP